MNLSRLRHMIVQGDISKQALLYLLECRSECEYLDFKQSLDLTSNWARANFATDAIAMKNTGGGYIVIGVEDKTWKRVGTPKQPLLDTKLLKDVIQKCLGVDFDIDIVHYDLLGENGSLLWFSIILIRASPKQTKRRSPTLCARDFHPNEKWGIRRGQIYFRNADSTVLVTNTTELDQLIDDLDNKHQQFDIEYAHRQPSSFAVEDGLYRLPFPGYETFIGRASKKIEILDAIERDERIWIVNLHGPGGVGKTALATWAAYEYYRNRQNVFEAILFLSAKERELTPQGINRITPTLYSLENLLQSLLILFSHAEYSDSALDKQKEIATEILSAYKTLVVLDNMESVQDGRIIDFVQSLPQGTRSKVLMTSRIRSATWEFPIKIEELSIDEVNEFVTLRSIEMKLDEQIRYPDNIAIIREMTGGLPLAVQWTLGTYALTGDLKATLGTATSKDSPLLEFSFRSSWDKLSQLARQALAILSIFDEPPSKTLWRTVLDWNVEQLDNAIDELQSMTFIYMVTDKRQGEITFHALPITLTFSRNMLAGMGPFEQNARRRYIDYKEKFDLVAARVEQYDNLFDTFAVRSDQERRAIVVCQMAERQESIGATEAEEYFKNAIEIEPRSVYVNVKYGRFLVSLGRVGEGLRHLKIATERCTKPTGFFAYYNLALVYDQLHDRGNCASALREALKFNPTHVVARHMLGVALSRLGRFDEAISMFDQLIQEETARATGPTNTLVYAIKTKVISQIKSQQEFSARETLENGIKLVSSYPSVSYLMDELREVEDRFRS